MGEGPGGGELVLTREFAGRREQKGKINFFVRRNVPTSKGMLETNGAWCRRMEVALNYLCICFKIFVCLLLNICVSDLKYPTSNVQDENVQGNVGDKWSSVQENGGRCTAPDFCRSNYLCICFRIFVCLLLNICVSALKYLCVCFQIFLLLL